jgi:hypothetical protein
MRLPICANAKKVESPKSEVLSAPLIEYAKCNVCNKVGNSVQRKGEMNLMQYFAGGIQQK